MKGKTDQDNDKLKAVMLEILDYLKLIQFYPPSAVGIRGTLLYLSMIVLIFQPAAAILGHWGVWDFNSRVTAIDNFTFSIGIMAMSSDIFLMPEKTKLFFDVINSKFALNRNQPSGDAIYREKCELVETMTGEGYRLVRTTGSVVMYFFTSHIVVPISGLAVYFLKSEPVENLPLLFKYYNPLTLTLDVRTIFEYLLITFLQLCFVFYSAILATVIHQMQMLSLYHMRVEMRLFHLNVKEIDLYCEKMRRVQENGGNEGMDGGNMEGEDGKSMEEELRIMVRKLVMHHQTIFRKVKDLNDGFKFRLFYFNAYICLQICLGIFIFMKGELLLKIKYGMILITITIVEFLFIENGQKLQDEGEDLRTALYNCSWRDKPRWFISTLKILMTRNNKLPKIVLSNVFTLNHNNMTVVMRGAYSYFNLLNNVSS
ncbi:hypothetical protein LSTR_LSTR010078 [Laodelphax striatellus]|uniref:Odorant receptor n=1 Tax=Laodelphax striatellus TaxID=195883 RepID=A0A482XFU4_LAOST|nr:hypothetical protein LSTR_LSTR010078 [Laodelphax striatellus]